MRIFRNIFSFFSLLIACSVARAQQIERFNSFSYNVNDGLLQSGVMDMAFDKNNFAWISFANGIQVFDGEKFSNVPVGTGLPDDKAVRFFVAGNKELFITHLAGISHYDAATNKIRQVYGGRFVNEAPLILGEDGDILYFIDREGIISGLRLADFKMVSRRKTPIAFPEGAGGIQGRPTDNIIDHRVGILAGTQLYLFNLANGRVIANSPPLPRTVYYASNLRLRSDHEILFTEKGKRNELKSYDFLSKRFTLLASRPVGTGTSFRSLVFYWKDQPFFTHYNRLFRSDSNFKDPLTEIVSYRNEAPAGDAVIFGTRQDHFGNLYLLTINQGFRKIISENYPIRYYGSSKNANRFYVSVCADKKNNRILAGVYAGGLIVFDTSQRVIAEFGVLPGEDVPFTPSSIVRLSNGNYLLFIFGKTAPWELSADLKRLSPYSRMIRSEATFGTGYFANVFHEDEENCWVFSEKAAYKLNKRSGRLSAFDVPEITNTACIVNGQLLTHRDDELFFLDTATFACIRRSRLQNTGGVRCYLPAGNDRIFVGTNKGIFIVDGKGIPRQHVGREQGLPDECIYAMALDAGSAVWCSTNKGIFKLPEDRSILQLNKDDGLQENEFNTNAVAVAEDGEMFFAGVNGLSSFKPEEISSFPERVNLLVTSIRINNKVYREDTAAWTIDRMDLRHDRNSLSISFAGMGAINPGQYIYQYRMKGIDEQWIQTHGLQTLRYHLPPGTYVFQLYASRWFDQEASPMREILIVVRPPFWKTWWFIGGCVCLLIGALIYGLNQIQRRRYEKKLMWLEGERKIKLERERISRDLHDSIGAYANAVLYKTDLISVETDEQAREALVADLKFVSKDIITSLRETIWALKKDQYSAGDCLIRIRNFVQAFNRYYNGIRFTVTGEAPPDLLLHSTRALDLVRIIQEAVTNAIKHSNAPEIRVCSECMDAAWKISVIDHGRGFDYAENGEQQQGNGLMNITQRAADSGFGLEIISAERQGTRVSVILRH